MSQPSSSSTSSFASSVQSLGTQRNAPFQGKLPKFAPPARIDPFAANEAFLSPANTTGDARTASPFVNSPRTDSAASGRFRMPPRSATGPYPRHRSPSPEMRIPQDGAFPLFPTKKVREDRARKERQRSKSMSRSQSSDRGPNPRHGSASTSASRSASPAMPNSPFPRGSGPRKASMSSQRSRGDVSPYREDGEPVPPLPAQLDHNGRASPKPERRPSPPAELPAMSPLSAPPITPNIEELEDTAHLQEQNAQRAHFKQPSISAAIKPLDAIGSARKPNQELGLSIPRSQSVSGQRSDPRIGDAPPVPEAQSAVVEHNPSPWNMTTTLPESPVLPRTTLPGMAEHPDDEAEHAQDDVLGNLPLIKSADQNSSMSNRARESASSDGSSYSVAQSTSSRSSPPTSASSFTLQNDLPRGENIDSVLSDIAEGTKPPPAMEPTLPQVDAALPGPALPLQQRRRGPAKSFSRPNYARPQLELPNPSNQSGDARPSPRLPPPESLAGRHDSPMDARSPRFTPEQRSPGSDSRSPVAELRSPPSSAPMSPRLPQMPRPIRPGDPYANVPPSPAGSLRRPTTPGFKGNCRGCGEMIVGKSVSSADGRLTGRYHKHCFVCRTCKEPFQTADFYVMDNHPYCHRHYHTLNQSLCSVCDRGIEGPYMETDADKKFHPHCFTCKVCLNATIRTPKANDDSGMPFDSAARLLRGGWCDILREA